MCNYDEQLSEELFTVQLSRAVDSSNSPYMKHKHIPCVVHTGGERIRRLRTSSLPSSSLGCAVVHLPSCATPIYVAAERYTMSLVSSFASALSLAFSLCRPVSTCSPISPGKQPK